VLTMHVIPCLQCGQPAPQSVSVSVPFCTWSSQRGFAQEPSWQTPL
jgi:hypothetical protein